MRLRLLSAVPVAALAVVAVQGASAGAPALTLAQSRLLWATVNVCDTAARPNTIGVRASMPGDGSPDEELFVRFTVQYLRRDGSWRPIGRGADSGFVALGPAKATVRETGRTFVLAPAAGRSYELRGQVTFEWRDAVSGDVVRRLQRVTTSGHRSAAGADPQGFSAAVCVMA